MFFLILSLMTQFMISGQDTDQYKKIEKLITDKKNEQAYTLLSELIKKNDKDAKAYLLTAKMYKDMGGPENIKTAEYYYYKVYKENEKDFSLELELGICSYLLGHKEKARMIFENIYKNKKEIKEINYYMGNLAFDNNNIEVARTYFKKELLIDKSNADVMFMLAVSYEKDNKDEAIKYYLDALKVNPLHVDSLFNLSVAYSTKKDQDMAIQTASKLLKIEEAKKMLGTIYYNLACFYSLKNDEKNSIDNLKKALVNGFNDFDHIKKDEDLKFLRDKKSFKELIK